MGLREQVTVLGRGRLGGDVFLGDAVIPLREVENFGASEVRRYTLGRRSTREKVCCLLSVLHWSQDPGPDLGDLGACSRVHTNML